jgi:hypothetical protein
MTPIQAQNSNWVERKQIERIQLALHKYSADCGFFPEDLSKLLEPSTKERECRNPRKTATLKDTPENRETVERLIYIPYGYHDYELSMRLYWTQGK